MIAAVVKLPSLGIISCCVVFWHHTECTIKFQALYFLCHIFPVFLSPPLPTQRLGFIYRSAMFCRNTHLDELKQQKLCVWGGGRLGWRAKQLTQHSAGRGHHPDLGLEQDRGMSWEVASRLVSGWWRGTGLQTRRFRAESGYTCLLFCWESEDLTHIFVVKCRFTWLWLRASISHRICCSEAKVTDLRSYTRNESFYQTVHLCIWPLSLMSCLVSVSLRLSEFHSHFSFAPQAAPHFTFFMHHSFCCCRFNFTSVCCTLLASK